MNYILTLPNYKGPFSFTSEGKVYSLPQGQSSSELDDETWKKIQGTPEIQGLIDAKLLHVLSQSSTPVPAPAPVAPAKEKKAE